MSPLGDIDNTSPVVGRRHLDADLAVQPRNVATQTEGSIIYALGHVHVTGKPAAHLRAISRQIDAMLNGIKNVRP